MPSPIEFGVVGAGWRTEFFMRVAAACPARFKVSGVVVRNPDKAAAFAAAWDVPTYGTPAEMLSATSPLFVVSCVSSSANHEIPIELVTAGMPVLTETPPGRTIENMNELWACVQQHGGKVQTAEQVHSRPHIQAQMAVARSGRIGTVSQAQICVAEGRTLAEIGLPDVIPEPVGYAIQCRVTTEDPEQDFLPDAGRLTHYRSPGGFGVRLDEFRRAAERVHDDGIVQRRGDDLQQPEHRSDLRDLAGQVM